MTFTAKFERPAVLPAGAYNATLIDIRDCEMQFQDKPPVSGLSFLFTVATAEGPVQIKRDVTRAMGERGNLYKMLRSMLGEALTSKVLASDARLGQALNYCIGKQYVITIELNQKGYSRIIAVAAMSSGVNPPVDTKEGVPSQLKLKGPLPANAHTGFEAYPDAGVAPVSQLPDSVSDDDLPF